MMCPKWVTRGSPSRQTPTGRTSVSLTDIRQVNGTLVAKAGASRLSLGCIFNMFELGENDETHECRQVQNSQI